MARIVGRPLDRRRPLWETYVIEGLPDGRFAILTKVHHATVDGASGAELLTMMLDADPEGDPATTPRRDEWTPERVPSATARCLAGAALAAWPASRAGRCCSAPAPPASSAQATRNPVLVAAANQVRASLRGPLGAVLNVGRDAGRPRARRSARCRTGCAPHAVQRADHRRTGASPSGRRR